MGLSSSPVMMPGDDWSPASRLAVTTWPGASLARSVALTRSFTVKSSSVRLRIGCPGCTWSPSSTDTLPMRAGQSPTTMSVGRNSTSSFNESSDTVTDRCPAGSVMVPGNGLKSTPGVALPTAW